MGIVDEDIVRVREAADIVAIISEHVGLKKSGRNFQGLCPFHAEKTPSFNVSPERGRYHCFGCDVGGDAITFLREIEHLDFVAAVEKLAGRTGIKRIRHFLFIVLPLGILVRWERLRRRF